VIAEPADARLPPRPQLGHQERQVEERVQRVIADEQRSPHTRPAEIVRAIELVHAGDGMLSPTVTRRLISMVAGDSDAGARAEHARARLATLSPRERDVALTVGLGHGNAEIAATLHVSVATVKGHVSRLLGKLEVDNRVQIALLVQAAREHQR
jgi:DNA-binding NarL/FixJ family response regulator